VLYCTAPVKKIVAIVEVADYLVGSPSLVWKKTAYGSGISRKYFRDYFSGKIRATAFMLGNVFSIDPPMDLDELTGQKTPPQSFYYLYDADVNVIGGRKSRSSALNSSMLFLGGVHGVGKSTMCQKALGPLGYRCETASSLITAYGNRVLRGKKVTDVGANQVALLEQLRHSRKQYLRFILDGHFTLVNAKGKIERIEADVFSEINPDRLILIKGDPKVISSRLSVRDGKKWDHAFLDKFQHEEEEHANYVAEKIGVPLQIFDSTIGYAKLARAVQSSL
jgi:adenylate kinase